MNIHLDAGSSGTFGIYTDSSCSKDVGGVSCTRGGGTGNNMWNCAFRVAPHQTYYIKSTSPSGGTIYATVDEGYSFSTGDCSYRPESDSFALGNGCNVKIYPIGADKTDIDNNDQATGEFKVADYVTGTVYRTSVFDDSTGDPPQWSCTTCCNNDIQFKNSWNAGTKTVSITSDKLAKGGTVTHSLMYGYMAESSNCKFLDLEGACVGATSCPVPWGITTNKISVMASDTADFFTYDYKVGECEDDAACAALYGSAKPICDTATYKCVGCVTDANCPADPDTHQAGICVQATKTCTFGSCTVGANTNSGCDSGYCCTGNNNPGPATGTTCVGKDVWTNPAWLCDPGVWFKCDESAVNTKQTFEGRTFSCIYENGNYKWVEQTSAESDDTNIQQNEIQENLFEGILKLLVSFLVFA